MVSLDSRVESANPLATLAPISSSFGSTTNLFAQQLTTALEGQSNSSGGGPSPHVQVREGSGQNSGDRQFHGAAGAEDSAAIPASSARGTTASGTTAPGTMEQLFSGRPAPLVPSATSVAQSTGSAAQSTETEAEAYWAEQPPAVQELQNMPVGPARDALAQSLAGQGYLIDNQIMVQGWDPQTTMMLRQDYGYTSVPAYGQTGSAKSIPVTTAFAVGTVQTQYALLMQSEAAT